MNADLANSSQYVCQSYQFTCQCRRCVTHLHKVHMTESMLTTYGYVAGIRSVRQEFHGFAYWLTSAYTVII